MMDYTIEGYDIHIEVREDGLINLDILYRDHDDVEQSITETLESLTSVLEVIENVVHVKLAGAQ